MNWWLRPLHTPSPTSFRIRTADGYYYRAWLTPRGWEVHFPHGVVRNYDDEASVRRAINRCIKQMEENADADISSLTL